MLSQTGRILGCVSSPALPVELSQSIERCALAVGDLSELRHEVAQLKARSSVDDQSTSFAALLFELELAKRGDVAARAELPESAALLLEFWRSGDGDALAQLHPKLGQLWEAVAPLLVQFEQTQFQKALDACWEARADAPALQQAMEGLQPEGSKRVEFARCLYHLELARQGVDSSRVEFATRAGLLAEAYQDTDFADDLIHHDAGLLHLWAELKPYLDEFFEGLEEQAARAMEGTQRFKIQVQTPEAPPSTPRPSLPLGDDDPVAASGPRPMPVPPGLQQRRPSAELELADIIEDEGPPPLPVVTPSGGVAPVVGFAGVMEIEAAEIIEEGPPPLPPTTVDDEEDAPPPSDETIAFWDYTFASLQLAPKDGLRARMLSTESRTDRKRLTTWLDGLGAHQAVPEAKAFAALVRLMLAGETKEKSLFGQANPRRKEALLAAFSLLGTDVRAASHAAVWFDLDGAETREALHRGLVLMMPFLSWCAQHEADPLSPQAVRQYLEK